MGHPPAKAESRLQQAVIFSKNVAGKSCEIFPPQNSVQGTEVTNASLKVCTINLALQSLTPPGGYTAAS